MLGSGSGMHTLITGGAGFIGSHLAERLGGSGDRITVLDDLSGGSLANLSGLGGALLGGSPGFRFVRGSVEDQALVSRLVREADRVVHLAAVVGGRRVVARGAAGIEQAFAGTRAVVRAAAAADRTLLLASTSEVYGDRDAVPFREADEVHLGPADRPRWSYACGKALAEHLALAYAREQGLRVVVARLFNTVGPRQSAESGMVIPTFARQALRGEPITVHGDGSQTRCFTHVADVVAALQELLAEPAAAGRIVNVGNDLEVSILDLALRVRELAGSRSAIEHVPVETARRDGFEPMRRRVPDLALLEQLVGVRPRLGLERILRDVLAWLRGGTHAAAVSPRPG